jgi:hypothetical protein
MSEALTSLDGIGVRRGAAAALAEELANGEHPLAATKATAEDDITAGTFCSPTGDCCSSRRACASSAGSPCG